MSLPAVSSKFPKAARILKSRHFQYLMRSGRRLSGEKLAITFRKGPAPLPRLGITISKRYGKAHDRNLLRRLIRESFRTLYTTLPPSLEINVAPLPSQNKQKERLTLTTIQKEFEALIGQIYPFFL